MHWKSCEARINKPKRNCGADTYGLLYWIVDAKVVRVEISLRFVASLRPKGAAFGRAGSTRLDSTGIVALFEKFVL